jgi:hypothetical protein
VKPARAIGFDPDTLHAESADPTRRQLPAGKQRRKQRQNLNRTQIIKHDEIQPAVVRFGIRSEA